MTKYYVAALLILFWPIAVVKGSCCIEHNSELDGIALVETYYTGGARLRFGLDVIDKPFDKRTNRNSEFTKRCLKGDRLFIHELGDSVFTCRASTNPDFGGLEAKAIDVVKVSPAIKVGHKSPNLFTLSFSPLATSRVSPTPLSEREAKEVTQFLRIHAKPPNPEKSAVGPGVEYEDLLSKTHRPTFRYYFGVEPPIQIGFGDEKIFFVPSFIMRTALDEDVLTSVVLLKNDSYRLLGTINGCIVRFGADLDGDGYPEVLTRLCVPNEYMKYRYYKFYPSIRQVISLVPG